MTKTGTSASFLYNEEGLRVRKTVGSAVTHYFWHGDKVTYMVRGSEVLYFWYDGQGRPAVVAYNGTKYAYVYSLQGDVLGLINSSGTEVVGYNYNAWGETLSVTGTLAATLGNIQPFRYRGYIYDYETGLYYLRSRYYNPVWCRFINADSVVKGNLYCYCENNPASLCDPDGFDPRNGNVLIDGFNTLCSIIGNSINAFIDQAKNVIVSYQQQVIRTMINNICGNTHDGGLGSFQIVSITKNVILSDDAKRNNAIVSQIIDFTSFSIGFIIAEVIKPLSSVIKASRLLNFIGAWTYQAFFGSINDYFIDMFTLRAGSYTSINCSYTVEYGFGLIRFKNIHNYDIRLYPDYYEVWYQYVGIDRITPYQKVGEANR